MNNQLPLLHGDPPSHCASGSARTASPSTTPAGERSRAGAVGGSSAPTGLWDYHGTGLLLPRGSVVRTVPVDDAELADIRDRLQVASDRRGVQAGSQQLRRVKRSAADSAALDAMCEWLSGHGLDLLATFTFSDDVAKQRGIYSLGRGLDVVAQELKAFSYHGKQGFRGKFVLTGEWHPSGRTVPHVHAALSSAGVVDVEEFSTALWRHFVHRCGRCRVEPMRDKNTATLYGLKDTLKSNQADATSVLMRLTKYRSYGKRKQS
jgi:hypothetical protein